MNKYLIFEKGMIKNREFARETINVTGWESVGKKERDINVLSGLHGELICGSFTVPMRELIACAYALG